MARRFLSAAVAGLAVGAAGLPAQARVTGEVVEFGEVRVSPSGPSRPPMPGELTLSREITTVYWQGYVNHSDHIEAALCRAFGISFKLDGAQGDGLPRTVLSRVVHPRITRPDGAASTADATYVSVVNGSGRALFVFDDPWEMQPGTWVFDVDADGETVLSTSFTVTLPAGPAQSVCEGPVS